MSSYDVVVRDGHLAGTTRRVSEADMSVVTCYMSTPPEMSLARLADAGVRAAHGTDRVRERVEPDG